MLTRDKNVVNNIDMFFGVNRAELLSRRSGVKCEEMLLLMMIMVMMVTLCTYVACSTSIYGSAVCVYNVSSIDAAFRGPFKSQVDAKSAWTRVPNHDVHECRRSSPLSTPTIHPGITPSFRHYMMQRTVPQFRRHATGTGGLK